jgi:FtsZ-interacting cell division protein ZipA
MNEIMYITIICAVLAIAALVCDPFMGWAFRKRKKKINTDVVGRDHRYRKGGKRL